MGLTICMNVFVVVVAFVLVLLLLLVKKIINPIEWAA